MSPEDLRKRYEAGATVDELVAASGLSYGTVLNRLREAGTVMRTSWQTRRLREGQARRNLAARLRRLYEQQGATLGELAVAGSVTRRAARRLLIEAGGTPRTTQQTLRIRSAANAARRMKLALFLRARYEAGATVPDLAAECNYSVGTVLSTDAGPADTITDPATKLQWQQVQALADYNCALAAFNDPNIGPVVVFPSDYAQDIDDLRKPPGWTSEYGEVPAEWPTPTTAKSPRFTLALVNEVQDAALRQVTADGDTTAYQVAVRYDGMSDRVVVETDAPSSVTDPLATAYPDLMQIRTVTDPAPADPAGSSADLP